MLPPRRPRPGTLPLFLAATAPALLVACHDPAPDAQLADATAAQRSRIIEAALGRDLSFAFEGAAFLVGYAADADCASVAIDGEVMTIALTCEAAELEGDIALRGTVTIDGFALATIRDQEWPADARMVVDYRALTFSGEDAAGSLDGTLTVDGADRVEAALTLDIDGLAVAHAGALTGGAGSWRHEAGYTLDIAGLGLAEVDGPGTLDGTPRGDLVIRGAQTLVVALQGDVACMPTTLDGVAAAEYCTDDY